MPVVPKLLLSRVKSLKLTVPSRLPSPGRDAISVNAVGLYMRARVISLLAKAPVEFQLD